MGQRVEAQFEKGSTITVPLSLHSGTLEVTCILLDQRKAFGRTEWLIVPAAGGDTPVWVTERTLLGETGVNASTG